MEYEDLAGVLPPYFSKSGDNGYNTQHGRASPTSYAATATPSPEVNGTGSRRTSVDATKRIRRKRSKKTMDIHAPGTTTPLLGSAHQTVQFHPYADHMTIPLPLMSVILTRQLMRS